MRFNPLDESMDMVGRDCPWILTIFLPSQLAQIVIWLITAMVYNSDLAFLSGSDEDWKTFVRKSHYFSCRLYAKGFERQDQGMQKNEVFVKGNILGLLNESRTNLMDFYVLPLTILGSLGAILLIGQNKSGQEGFLFLFWSTRKLFRVEVSHVLCLEASYFLSQQLLYRSLLLFSFMDYYILDQFLISNWDPVIWTTC